jgi:hypothetical protein
VIVSSKVKKAVDFLKKLRKKLLMLQTMLMKTPAGPGAKVFWFFFLKKNIPASNFI